MYNLAGKVAIVTGSGRPHGLGQGIAKRLAREGADVVIVDVCKPYEVYWGEVPEVGRGSWEDLQERKKEIEALGVRCLAVKCDATDEQDVDALVAATLAEFGHIDILCNNIGGGHPRASGPLLEVDGWCWEQGMAVNFKTAHLCSRAVAKQMIAQGKGGKIVNTASQAAVRPFPLLGMYCSAKAALVMYTKSLALELASHKINVNAIGPGTIETDMLKEAFTGLAKRYLGITYEQFIAQTLPTIPLGRLETPEDVASCAVWLCSAEADYITGVFVLTTGGQTIY